jgi:hypothetical protein
MSKNTDREFLRLRALARTLLLKEGTAVAPGSQTPERVDEWIGDLVAKQQPTLRSTSDALYARLPDRDIEIAVNNHGGTLMAAYGDAGYFVGLSVGLELAALTFAGALPAPATSPTRDRASRRTNRAARKGGAR